MKKHNRFSRITKAIAALALSVSLLATSVIPSQAAVTGIDVSKYQGLIDWNAVRASGVAFTFVKVGSTKSGIDPYFAYNVTAAQAAGIRTGVYIYSYATSVEAAVAEANLVLQWIEGYNINFPVAYDIEDKIQAGIDPNTITAMCNAFCDTIALAGYQPIVYSYTNFYARHMTPALRYDKWAAQFGSACNTPGHTIWQYSETGAVPGVGGHVDMNIMLKDYASIIIPVGIAQRDGFSYLYNNFRIQFGWTDLGGMRFHSDALGHMNFGWFTDETGLYYLAADGHAVVGPNQIGNDGYYFNEIGQNIGGWIAQGPFKFYYDPANGNRMLKGWFQDQTGMHYLSPADGHMITGPITIEKNNYLFSAEGNMLVGWQDLAGLRFYYNPTDGKMFKGWLGDVTNRFYLSPADGHMITGLQNIDKNTYYFGNDGKMLTGWQTIGGVTYFFDLLSGAMVKGLVPGADGFYATSEADGHQLKNETAVINKVQYVFGPDGKMVIGQLIQIGNMLYLTDATGAVTASAPVAQ